jgi:hypothetical protein
MMELDNVCSSVSVDEWPAAISRMIFSCGERWKEAAIDGLQNRHTVAVHAGPAIATELLSRERVLWLRRKTGAGLAASAAVIP